MNAQSKGTTLLVFLIIFSVSIASGIIVGPQIPFAIQKTLAAAVSGLSSIMFGVLGIWIGLMAPENLRAIYTSKSDIAKMKNWKDLELLYRPVFISMSIFAIATIFGFVGEIFKAISALSKYYIIFRSIGFSILISIMIFTVQLILISMRPGILILINSFSLIKKSENINSHFPDRKIDSPEGGAK